MKKMGLNSSNLLKNNTKVAAAEESTIKVIGFISVNLSIIHEGTTQSIYECLYFSEGFLTTLVSLGALKNLKCVPDNFPYPSTESASSHTKRDHMDDEGEEEKVKPRDPMPLRADQLPFLLTEENIPKLKAWLIQSFLSISFNTSSAPLGERSNCGKTHPGHGGEL